VGKLVKEEVAKAKEKVVKEGCKAPELRSAGTQHLATDMNLWHCTA
jgi:hypothetical protein